MGHRFDCKATPSDYLTVLLDSDGDIALTVHEFKQTPRMIYLGAEAADELAELLADLADRASAPGKEHVDSITAALNREGLAIERDPAPAEADTIPVSPADTQSLPIFGLDDPTLTGPADSPKDETAKSTEEQQNPDSTAGDATPAPAGTFADAVLPQPTTVSAERAYVRARELLQQGDTPFTHAAVLDLARYLTEAA
ncbi:hypothetical protein [Streptomyces olivoreticuli]|uniref:hypothetical protein n=1 Tax=Streptomyces olivoreticuli TaxID=68246 RepID=UPI000E221FE2|nr:hypothetical protein [Streptomyces olivoreticuli]